MLPFNINTQTIENFNILQTDIHAHLIPGIDDGPKDMDQALELITELVKLGYKKLYATPHVMADHYPNEVSDIQHGLIQLKHALLENNIHIEIHAAAEYFLDENFQSLIEKGELLAFSGNYILIETSTLVPPERFHEQIFSLKTKGYTPILAHPERYPYYADNFKKYYRIKEYGCKFQVNIPSFAGYYGRSVKQTALKLIKSGLVDFLGTDVHHMQHIKAVQKALDSRRFNKILQTYQFKNSKI